MPRPGDHDPHWLEFNRARANPSQITWALDQTAEGVNGEVASAAKTADGLVRRTADNAARLAQTVGTISTS